VWTEYNSPQSNAGFLVAVFGRIGYNLSMKKILSLAWKEFIYGGHLQCLGVVSIVYISSFLLNIKTNWEILALAYLIFYPIYINDRFKWIKPDESTNPERTKYLKSYLWLTPRIILFSVLLLLVLLIHIGNMKLAILSLILLVFGLLYPLYFKNLTKKIFAFKNLYVALFFTAMAILPVLHSHQPFAVSLLVSFIFLVFLKTTLMQILLDCKDVKEDKAIGLLTVAALIGREKTFTLLRISNVFIMASILLLSFFLIEDFPWQMLVLFLVIPFNFYSYYLAQRHNYYGYILGSGEFLLWPVLILIARAVSTTP